MPRRFAILILPIAVVVSSGLTGCNQQNAKPNVTTIALGDYAISAPATMPAGFATFRTVNTGKEMHQAALVRLDSGKTITDFDNAMKTEGAPPPRWIEWLGGPQDSSEVSLALSPGTYVWYCAIPSPDGTPHIAKGMSAPMRVTDSGVAAAAPVADIDVTMHDYAWDLSRPITVGQHTLKITTAPGQPHEMVIVRLADGKTAQDLVAWIMKPEGPPPASRPEGIAAMQAGETNYDVIDFKPGRYAFLCFLPDAQDGKPHVTHGMVKEFTVQ